MFRNFVAAIAFPLLCIGVGGCFDIFFLCFAGKALLRLRGFGLQGLLSMGWGLTGVLRTWWNTPGKEGSGRYLTFYFFFNP